MLKQALIALILLSAQQAEAREKLYDNKGNRVGTVVKTSTGRGIVRDNAGNRVATIEKRNRGRQIIRSARGERVGTVE